MKSIKYKVGDRVFDSITDAYAYVEEEELSIEDIEELEVEELSLEDALEEEEGLDDTPESDMDETEVITEEELKGIAVLQNYENIEDETLKTEIISRALGQSVGSDKVFKEPIKLEDIDKEYLVRISDQIKNGLCPFCSRNISQLEFFRGIDLENLSNGKLLIGSSEWGKSMLPSPEQIKESVGLPKLVIEHIRVQHGDLYKVLKDLFEEERIEPYPEEPKEPESCSELTKEELSEEKLSKNLKDPNFRDKVYRNWLIKKQKERKK